jgi:hypothetical protein
MAQRSYFSQCGDRNEPLTFAPEKVISYGQDVVLRKADEGVAISVCAADRDQLDVSPSTRMVTGVDLNNGSSLEGLLAGLAETIARAGRETRIIPGHGPIVGRPW